MTMMHTSLRSSIAPAICTMHSTRPGSYCFADRVFLMSVFPDYGLLQHRAGTEHLFDSCRDLVAEQELQYRLCTGFCFWYACEWCIIFLMLVMPMVIAANNNSWPDHQGCPDGLLQSPS